MSINAASTVSLEFILKDKPVINLDFDPPGSNLAPCDGFKRHIRFDHFWPVAQSGGTMVAQSEDDMRQMLIKGLTEPGAGSRERKQFIKEFYGSMADGNSGQRVANCLMSLAQPFLKGEINMPQLNSNNTNLPARPRLQWPVILVTLLIGVTAIWLAWPQVFHRRKSTAESGPEANAMTLPNLNRRASELEQITNLIQRDSYCVPLSAYGRALDHALAPDARIFLSGMIGKENGPRLGIIFF